VYSNRAVNNVGPLDLGLGRPASDDASQCISIHTTQISETKA
jgi:hypothetical protein